MNVRRSTTLAVVAILVLLFTALIGQARPSGDTTGLHGWSAVAQEGTATTPDGVTPEVSEAPTESAGEATPTDVPSPDPGEPTATSEPSPTEAPTEVPTEAPATATPEAPLTAQGQPTATYIVRLKPGVAHEEVIRDRVSPQLGRVTHRYDAIINGFAVELPEPAVQALQRDPRVMAVTPDFVVRISQQVTPKGIERVGTLTNPIAKIDGRDERVDVDVAVLDTGVAPHPDLNIAGGVDCTGSGSYDDPHGHGTHVAGTIGALDNGVGVVGVAPGARIWAVKVLGADGSGKGSWILCGVDWITKHGAIEIANMSLSGQGNPDDNNCGFTNGAVLHQAICASVNRGVTYVVAAGNSNADAANFFPAHYDEVITVSALADSDGKPGGLGSSTSAGADDMMASFSNYGADVDVIAPGVSIYSTARGGGYSFMSGTSMASPHVAGAAALYKVANPWASPADIQAGLIAAGSTSGWTGDKDGFKEPLIDVSTFGKTQMVDRSVISVSAPASVTQGTTVTVTATIGNNGSESETIAATLIESPNGFTRTTSITVAPGTTGSVSFSWPTSTTTATGEHTLTVTVPAESDSNASNNRATATIHVEATAPPPSMSVNSITLSSTAVSGGYQLTSQVNVRSNGANVSGAAVTVDFTMPNGSKQSQTATTNTSGVATFYLSVTATGTYTVTVTNVTKSGYIYNAAGNTVTSRSVTISSTTASMSVSGLTLSKTNLLLGGYRLTSQATIKSGGKAVSGASVTVRFTDPNGSTTTMTATTNTSGVATFNRSVTARGTYTVTVTNVTKSGLSYDAARNTISSRSLTI